MNESVDVMLKRLAKVAESGESFNIYRLVVSTSENQLLELFQTTAILILLIYIKQNPQFIYKNTLMQLLIISK